MTTVPLSDPDVRAAIFRALHQVAPEVDPASLKPDANLRDQVDLDSMDVLNVMAALSERIGVDIPEVDYPELATIGGAARYVAEHGT